MDEGTEEIDGKTEELRDIFVEVTEEETVTESQDEERGTLLEKGAASERIGDIVADMREEYEFESSLSDEELATVVVGFYRDETDAEIAEELDTNPEEVFDARLDLHLVRESDTDAPFDLAEFRDVLVADGPGEDLAERLDVSEPTVDRFRRVVETQNESRRVSDRYRSGFEDALVEVGLGEHLTTDVQDDGLEDATEGVETDVSF